jgi:nicotinamidase-related amidase
MRPVLVVVDVQNGFINDASRHVVPVIAEMVDRWQEAQQDVVFTRYFNFVGSPHERLFGWRKLHEPPETEIVAELTDQAGRATAIIDKRIYSLFTPEGGELVRHHGWTDLYICGIATESCVLKTAVDAFERGDLTPWIVEDASASHAGQVAHDAGLLVAQRFISPGQIIRAAELPLCPSPRNAHQPDAWPRRTEAEVAYQRHRS